MQKIMCSFKHIKKFKTKLNYALYFTPISTPSFDGVVCLWHIQNFIYVY